VLLNLQVPEREGAPMLFVGDDWAEDHHDVEVVDDQGSVLARRRLPEGFDGVAALHALIANHLPQEWADLEPGQAQALVKVGIETDRGPWVAALVAAGYQVFAINPMSVARYRERQSTSGAKSDAADAHLLAEIVRLDRAHHRPVAGDGEAIPAHPAPPCAPRMRLVAHPGARSHTEPHNSSTQPHWFGRLVMPARCGYLVENDLNQAQSSE
jgi:Transposase